MIQVVFAVVMCALIGLVCGIVTLIQSRKSKSKVERSTWNKEHMFEIVTAMKKLHITINTFGPGGRSCDSSYDLVTHYVFVNNETGQQTRLLDSDEFYDLMRKAENTKSDKINKLIFGKYLYRQFNVK